LTRINILYNRDIRQPDGSLGNRTGCYRAAFNDLVSLETTQLFNLIEELNIPPGQAPHFKSGFTAQGRVVAASNQYWEEDFKGEVQDGRLAEWNGNKLDVLERNPFVEVSGKQNPRAVQNFGNTLFATGWNKSSVILRVLHNGQWSRYLLPKASHTFDHAWNTEWMRIREVQTERYLMDVHGMFYKLPALVYDDKIWGIRPICTHLRIIPVSTKKWYTLSKTQIWK